VVGPLLLAHVNVWAAAGIPGLNVRLVGDLVEVLVQPVQQEPQKLLRVVLLPPHKLLGKPPYRLLEVRRRHDPRRPRPQLLQQRPERPRKLALQTMQSE
jgi:hypothetical protein